ncbi:MAG: radical SAM protein [Myxococcales bacterium]|jgi:pyruvate-formate lyase-activating enzyme|nr:radical SAM protein [Myxococcales bacterium]
MTQPKLLLATPEGLVLEHPTLLAPVRSGDDLLLADEPPIPLPDCGGRLAHLPGHRPIGFNPKTGHLARLDSFEIDGRRFAPNVVAALLPPGYTRTFLPAAAKVAPDNLPQWAYTAAGWGESGPVVFAVRTDERDHWNSSHFSTPELQGRVDALCARLPNNGVVRHLTHCALVERCFTAQNIFYGRDEGGLPSSNTCNARCLGCISERRPGGPPSSMSRLDDLPTIEDLAELGAHHLTHATGHAMVSFGQGCEGEPLTRASELAEAMRRMRQVTPRGSININTNGSLTKGLSLLLDQGLDAVRFSLNSADPALYGAYYAPQGYALADVRRSIGLAREAGAYIALNLLSMPGVNDRLGEVERLRDLVVEFHVDQIQTRSLCIDPEQYLALARGRGAGGDPIGVRAMIDLLLEEAPWLRIGNFARGLDERAPRNS